MITKEYILAQFDNFGGVFGINIRELCFIMETLAEGHRLEKIMVSVTFELGGYRVYKA